MSIMKIPSQCQNLQDVRKAIDTIDKEVIKLLGKRMEYVLAASQFKPTESSISAPDRVISMLAERKQWAEGSSLDPDFIVPLYAQIIQWYITKQTQYWRKKKNI